MNDTTTPAKVNLGDRIEHDQLPGYTMHVRGLQWCETTSARPEEHLMYLVTDPDDHDDWLCAYDVHPVT